MKRKTWLAIVLCAGLGASTVLARDWPQWRGPSRNGAAATVFKPPATWPDRPKQVWKVQVGLGHSSPILAADRVFLFSRIGEQEVLTARDLGSGKEVWRQAYDAPYVMNPAATSHGKGPKSTPVFDRGRIYTFGIGGVLSAWQAQDGRSIWRKDFKKDFKATVPDFGVAMSPIVAGDLVIVHAGGQNDGAVMALDAATGALTWSWKGDGPAYASPMVADLSGTRQVITQSQRAVVALALADGKPLWQIPFRTEYDQNSVTPLVIKDVVVYAGMSKPTTAVRVARTAGKWTAAEVWQNADVPMYMSSPVETGGLMFGLTHRNRGQYFCLDAATGKTMWMTKGREGENAALVTVPGLVMAMTTEGELVVFRANQTQFEAVKRYTLADSAVWAHPALTPDGVVVKDVDSLAYWKF
jgi:outer membrane protein assembly factor BamB